MRFTYKEITTVILISLAFWVTAITIVPLGGAAIGLIRTVRTIPNEKRTEYENVVYFLSATRSNVRRGLPLTAVVLVAGAMTGLYIAGFLSTSSIEFLIGGLLGVYVSVLVFFLLLRVSNLLARESALSVRDTWGQISSGEFFLDILYIVLVLLGVLLSVVLPVLLILLLPGFLAVFESVIYEAQGGAEHSMFRKHIELL